MSWFDTFSSLNALLLIKSFSHPYDLLLICSIYKTIRHLVEYVNCLCRDFEKQTNTICMSLL